MSTAVNPAFVIEARADAKLNEISSEFADAILGMAAAATRNRDAYGRPMVDACDIEAAARSLCNALQRVSSRDPQFARENAQILQHLRAVCDEFSHECEQSSAYPASGNK